MNAIRLLGLLLLCSAYLGADITLKTVANKEFGDILTDNDGKTLYISLGDGINQSNCYDQCAIQWPPLLIKEGKPVMDPSIQGTLDTFARRDNTKQVTYNGKALYYYAQDKKPGDMNGLGIDNKWFVVCPKVISQPQKK